MLAVRAERAFDGERAIAGGALVLVEGGRIVGVEPASAPIPEAWPVLDVPGATLLPGLIDTHVHLCGDNKPDALERLGDFTDAELEAVIDRSLAQQLAAGVTTVRDLGDRRWAVLARRDRADGRPSVPAILAAGPPVTSRGGHCWAMGGEAEADSELRRAVQDRVDRRADVIKVMATGGTMTPGTDVMACQFGDQQLRTIVELAHAAGLPVTMHAHGLAGVEQAVRSGADGIEHCSCFTPAGISLPAELLDSLAARRIAVCPTLGHVPGIDLPPAVQELLDRAGVTWELRLDVVRRAHGAGVVLVSGDDSGIGPGKAHGIQPLAVAELVEAGIPAAEALASATSVAARVCGVGKRKGRIRAGYDADLILVDGDPLADISALQRVAAVILRGTVVKP